MRCKICRSLCGEQKRRITGEQRSREILGLKDRHSCTYIVHRYYNGCKVRSTKYSRLVENCFVLYIIKNEGIIRIRARLAQWLARETSISVYLCSYPLLSRGCRFDPGVGLICFFRAGLIFNGDHILTKRFVFLSYEGNRLETFHRKPIMMGSNVDVLCLVPRSTFSW